MPSSRWLKLVCTLICPPLAAAALLFSSTSSVTASINQAAALAPPAAAIAKSCSGAFRYAARAGNDDIVEVSPVQAFAKDRRLARMRTRFPDADVVVFGHSHLPLLQWSDDGRFAIFNPGSPTERRRAPFHTMGEAVVDGGGRVELSLIRLA